MSKPIGAIIIVFCAILFFPVIIGIVAGIFGIIAGIIGGILGIFGGVVGGVFGGLGSVFDGFYHGHHLHLTKPMFALILILVVIWASRNKRN